MRIRVAQILDFIDKDVFLRLANKYDGNCYVKQFTCYNQHCVLMFGQLSSRESLRDVVLATLAHASKAYHLGFGKHAATLPRALLQMPTPNAIIASSRNLNTRSLQKLNDAE